MPLDTAPELIARRFDETQRLARLGSWELDLASENVLQSQVWWSDETFRLLGHEPRAIVPSPESYLERVPEDERDLLVKATEEAMATGGMDLQHRVLRPDGEGVLHLRGELVRDADGKPLRLVGTVQDVTERVRAERQIREAQENLARELDAFSYSISHDLRAPLRSIDGFARLLQQDHAAALPPQARDYLDRVTRSATHMGRLIDGLLAFSRVGRQAFTGSRIDMNALVDTALGQLKEGTQDRQVDWVRAPLPEAHGDPALLREVWMQLLSNALKFTRGRTPARIEVGYDAAGGTPGYFVRDNGVGFDPRYTDRLFAVFQRLHRADEYEGCGVGLAIARRAIERHGGTIAAEGAVGAGAVVRFGLGEPMRL